MTMANYPGGFKDGISIRGVPLMLTHPGKVFWVSNATTVLQNQKGGSDGNDGSFNAPFATIDYAVGRCTAGRGDVIFVKPGHSEAITTADIDVDVAGIAIIGLGTGTNRPTITYTGTTDTTTFDVSANNVFIHNLLFNMASNDAVDNALVVNGTDVELSALEFRADGTAQPDTFVTVGLADADADRSYIHDCKFISLTAGANNAISVDFDMDGLRIENNWIDGDWADAGIDIPAGGNACTNLRIEGNYVRNRQSGDHAIQVSGVTSGCIKSNTLVADTVDIILSAVTNMVYIENYGSIGQTEAGGRSFPVPAHMYGDRARQRVKNSDTVDSGVTYTTGATTTLFTVTGAVFARVWGHVTTAIVSTSDTGTITVGIAGNTAKLVPSYTAGSGTIVAHDILGNAGTTAVPGDDIEGAGTWVYIGGGEDIVATVATNNLTSGVIDWYCEWYPISDTGRVVSA